MEITRDQLDGIAADGDVVAIDGDKIGGLGQIYLDDNTGEPKWVTVKTGLFGTSETFVPLDGASLSGGEIFVNYDKATVKDAPRVDADGNISPEEEDILYTYYSLGGTSAGDDPDRAGNVSGTIGSDYSATDTGYDAAGTETRETGRARLRKYVVAEDVTQTVPAQREEARVVRGPITEENRPAAESGPAISENDREVVLPEERPGVEQEAVPVERVRLDTDSVTDVGDTDEDRKENVDTGVGEDRPKR